MDCPRGSPARLHCVNEDHSVIADQQFHERYPGETALKDIRFTVQLIAETPHSQQTDGIVRDQFITETQDQSSHRLSPA